ncbi:Rad1/Rec1/Rad17 [Kockiozyma suomiensis]|uniref:Rad1/Rec1/Rad17 n=1 Tax=Kockiozyma suomiensis TaxID=1337062 RepID=UPI003343EC52
MVVSEPEPPILDAVSTCVAFIYRMLNSLGRVSPRATVSLAAEGITVSAESSRACQAHAFLDKSFFSSYVFNPPQHTQPTQSTLSSAADDLITFSIQLEALIECFQIFGSEVSDLVTSKQRFGGTRNTSAVAESFEERQQFVSLSSVCKLRYNRENDPFLLMLDEGASTTTCEFTTATERDEIADIILSTDALHLNAIMKPGPLIDAFRELDTPGSEPRFHVSARKSPPEIELTCVGDLGSFSWKATRAERKDSSAIETLVIADETDSVQYSYSYSMFQRVREAVKLASMISLRIDQDGIMSVQAMCDIGDGRKGFIDFRFLPIEENVA